MPAILAKKLGMTQLFLEDGRVERVTVLEAGPCPVTGIRTLERDGYEAVQLAFGAVKEKHITKAELGHLKKADAQEGRGPRPRRLVTLADLDRRRHRLRPAATPLHLQGQPQGAPRSPAQRAERPRRARDDRDPP